MIKRFVIPYFFLAAATLFFFQWRVYAFSQHAMEGYDEAIKFISRAYVSFGFVPYKDFGIVYAPGVFFLAHVIPFTTIEQQNLVMYAFFPVIILAAAGLLYLFRVSYGRFLFCLAGFMLLTIPLLISEDIADPLLGLLVITVVLAVRYRAGPIITGLLFLVPFLVIHWRWDRILTFLVLEAFLFLSFAWWYWLHEKKEEAKHVARIVLVQIAGLIAGLANLAIYLSSHGGLASGMEFIYRLPVQVILEYRDLPLPPLSSFPGILIFSAWFAHAIFFLYTANELLFAQARRDPAQVMISFFLILAPFAGLPYALGRSDSGHFYPMLFLTGLNICVAVLVSKRKWSLILVPLLVALIIPALRFLPAFSYAPEPIFSTTRLLEEQLADCRKKTETSSYRSLFVGRTLYEKYYANNVALYFLNPSIVPATRHIHDDPGVQNSCVYGERIAAELDRAPKPMLAFLTDQPMDRYEENKTREMKSCGKIEGYLTSHPYRVLGTCVSYAVPYEIRMYD